MFIVCKLMLDSVCYHILPGFGRCVFETFPGLKIILQEMMNVL